MENSAPRKESNGCGAAAGIMAGIVLVYAIFGFGSYFYFQNQTKADGARVLAKAQKVATYCKNYAGDHNGMFPDAGRGSNANDCFRLLFLDYVSREEEFVVEGSNWGAKADNLAPYLEAGENHWSYIAGLKEDMEPFPLILEGGVEDDAGSYTRSPERRGGRGKGKRVAYVMTDLSANISELSFVFIGYHPADLDFSTMPFQSRILNPAKE